MGERTAPQHPGGPPAKLRESLWRRLLRWQTLDLVFFAVALGCVLLLGVVFIRQGWRLSPQLGYLLAFWLLLSYLALPRLHRILTAIYVPGYFIGRTQTTDGLLGDPVNLAVRGDAEDLHRVLQAAGWTLADPLSLGSSVRMVRAAVGRRSYPHAPVSTLMLFGEPHAFAYQQEVAGNPAQRHHVRFWRAPSGWLLPGGQQVDWLAAGTYDRSVGLSLFTGQVTHKIDANIDVERDHILTSVERVAPDVHMTVLKHFATGYHSRNGGGDVVQTDGNLPIIELRATDLEALPPPTLPDDEAEQLRPEDDLVTATTKAAHRAAARPVQLIAGVLVVLLGFLPDVLSYLPHVGTVITDVADDVHATENLHLVVWITLGLLYAVLLGLVVLTYRGQTWARFLLLSLLCVQILGQLLQWVTLAPGILPPGALLATSLYVLGVYWLTSLSVSQWERQH